MAQLLYTTAYKKPGVYIGQIIEPSGDSIATASRIPVMIGKGSRYAQATNSAVTRAYVYEEELEDISAAAPYTATLKHTALKDQSKAALVRKSDGYVIPESKWYFPEDDDHAIVISDDVYLVDDEYTLSYQSLDRSVVDPTPVNDIISISTCGNSPSTTNYVENRDYYIGMKLDNLKKVEGSQEVETTDLAFDPRYDYETVYEGKIFPTAKDNRKVTITVTNVQNQTTYDKSATTEATWLEVDASEFTGTESENIAIVATKNSEGSGAEAVVDVSIKIGDIEVADVLSENEWVSLTGAGKGLKVKIPSFDALDDSPVNTSIAVTVEATSYDEYTIYYASNTPEGGFGTVKANSDDKKIILPGNIILIIADGVTLVQNAKYTFDLTNQNQIHWDLTLQTSTLFRADSVYRDVNGTKTGIAGAYYVILAGIPLSEPQKGETDEVTLTWIEGTSYVMVSSADGTKPQKFTISYEYAGNEPAPGETYYITTKHIRPDNMFNKVIFVSSRAEGEALLAPSTSKNDLYIANEIAWDEIGTTAGRQIAYIQIKDSDDDGVLSSADVQTAIDALATSKRVTDYCLLGNFEYLGKMLVANEVGNDPFECRENELWVGAPVGTEVGDINTDGSLVQIAQSSMKIYGAENPAHGTRMLVAPTEATKKITLEGNVEQTLKLDGSFVAWALACHRSRMRTADSIMRQQITAFNSMQVYNDVEDIVLGSNQIIYFSKAGDGIYTVEEDFTVDKFAFEFSLEQTTSQRLQLVRDLRNFMNESLIGYTPDTPAGGVNIIMSFLVRGLKQKIKEGTIGPYRDETGAMREIDPSKDIFVTYVKDNPTQYQFGYGFYTKTVMKQLFGSYVVDKNFADTGLGN